MNIKVPLRNENGLISTDERRTHRIDILFAEQKSSLEAIPRARGRLDRSGKQQGGVENVIKYNQLLSGGNRHLPKGRAPAHPPRTDVAFDPSFCVSSPCINTLLYSIKKQRFSFSFSHSFYFTRYQHLLYKREKKSQNKNSGGKEFFIKRKTVFGF
jgi:hypothetical protein